MRVSTVSRPYVITAGNLQWMASSLEVDRLLGVYPIVRVTAYKLVLQASSRIVIIPATRGGGVAFVVTR